MFLTALVWLGGWWPRAENWEDPVSPMFLTALVWLGCWWPRAQNWEDPVSPNVSHCIAVAWVLVAQGSKLGGSSFPQCFSLHCCGLGVGGPGLKTGRIQFPPMFLTALLWLGCWWP